MNLQIKPIGVIRTPFKSEDSIPIQTSKSETIAEVELLPEYIEGLESLDEFSHIILVYWFHRAKPCALTVTPFLDSMERGLFSTRAPTRPNPIGLSIVKVVRIEGNIIRFIGADMLNDTPLIDIKPFIPEFDNRLDATSGWLTESIFTKVDEYIGDDRFLR
ncbi:MAG: tRNA (N6-threonylcarbamoyladenosine(37)-N6)-methyltransferase TrmO [Candidatus Thorarchaeota archaeon]